MRELVIGMLIGMTVVTAAVIAVGSGNDTEFRNRLYIEKAIDACREQGGVPILYAWNPSSELVRMDDCKFPFVMPK